MNNDFFKKAFSDFEKSKIVSVNNANPNNPDYGTAGGRSTDDKVFALSFEDAEKLKLLEDDPKMKPTIRKKVSDALGRNLSVWMTGVELAIEDFNQIETLPDQVMLCGGGASLSQIPEILATGDWYKNLAFSRRPVIQLISPEDVPGIENSTDKELDHTFVTAMGLLRVGMDTLVGVGDNKSFRARLTKLLQY